MLSEFRKKIAGKNSLERVEIMLEFVKDTIRASGVQEVDGVFQLAPGEAQQYTNILRELGEIRAIATEIEQLEAELDAADQGNAQN